MNSEIKILVIDDEEGIRDWLFYELGKQGYKVTTVPSGKLGIEKIKREKFDIAIVDIRMPEMDGITVLNQIKRVNADIEVIMSTGYGTLETAVESMKQGACDFIHKPYSVKDLRVAIDRAIEKQHLRESAALLEISNAIFSTIELDKLLDKSIELTMKVLNADDSSLMLLDKEKQLYIAASSYDLSDEEKKLIRLAIGKRISGWVAKEKHPVLLIEDMEHDVRFEDIKGRKEIKSSMVLPLIGKRDLLGILNISRVSIPDHFTRSDLQKATIFASQIALAVENAYFFQEINTMYLSTIASLANALDAKDSYTNRHSERVADYAVKIGVEMKLNEAVIRKIYQASQIHDIGKIGIHDQLINKNSALSDKEMEEMKAHPLKGAEILKPLGYLNDIVEIVKQHHERYDGTGYPFKLKGNQILLEARIIAAADAFDAMTSDRPYRKALTRELAVAELKRCSGNQFDPQVVAAFLNLLQKDSVFVNGQKQNAPN